MEIDPLLDEPGSRREGRGYAEGRVYKIESHSKCHFLQIERETALVDRSQPLLFGCFLAIGCQKVQNRLFNGYETVK